MSLLIVGAGIAGICLGGCRTTPEPGVIREGAPVPFLPQSPRAQVQLGPGNSMKLYSDASYATWLMGGLPGADGAAAAAALGEDLLTYQLYLESAGGDMSISYDAVGLRNVDVYLVTPAGRRILPAHRAIDANLIEKRQGALKVFGRNVTLVFSGDEAGLAVPAGEAPGEPVRLVLEGYGTMQYFEWSPDAMPANAPPRFSERDEVQQVKRGYRRAVDRAKTLSHEFD